jgi:hypothetical protein
MSVGIIPRQIRLFYILNWYNKDWAPLFFTLYFIIISEKRKAIWGVLMCVCFQRTVQNNLKIG